MIYFSICVHTCLGMLMLRMRPTHSPIPSYRSSTTGGNGRSIDLDRTSMMRVGGRRKLVRAPSLMRPHQ